MSAVFPAPHATMNDVRSARTVPAARRKGGAVAINPWANGDGGPFCPDQSALVSGFSRELLNFPAEKHDEQVEALGLIDQMLNRIAADARACSEGKSAPARGASFTEVGWVRRSRLPDGSVGAADPARYCLGGEGAACRARRALVLVVSRIFRTFDQATASVCTTCG